jgi:ABC-2 type transport system permease protein
VIGWVIGIILLAALGAAAAYGLFLRAKRLGFMDGVLKALSWPFVSVLIGGSYFILIFTATEFTVAKEMAFWITGVAVALLPPALGWDEFLDRVAPGFYACVRRELYRQFSTPIPWFVLFLFTMLVGVLFWGNLDVRREITMRYAWGTVASLGSLLFPLLTMGVYSQERSEGTIEVLMTAPISSGAVTVSKFFSTMSFYLVMLAPTLIYYAILKDLGQDIGKPDAGPAVTSYIGLILAGGFYISLGVFFSALTSSQILAALLTWVFIIFFDFLAGAMPGLLGIEGTDLGGVIEYLQPGKMHLLPFLKGVVDPKNVLFFLSFTVFFLFLAARASESRKGR